MPWHYPGDNVFHTRRECPEGAKLRGIMRIEGTGGLPQCPICKEFEAMDGERQAGRGTEKAASSR